LSTPVKVKEVAGDPAGAAGTAGDAAVSNIVDGDDDMDTLGNWLLK